MVPGRTDMIVPSSSMAFSEFIIGDRASRRSNQINERRLRAINPDLPAITGELAVTALRTRPFFTRARLVYVQCAAVDFLAVERGHGGIGFGLVFHGDERKTARFAGHAVH